MGILTTLGIAAAKMAYNAYQEQKRDEQATNCAWLYSIIIVVVLGLCSYFWWFPELISNFITTAVWWMWLISVVVFLIGYTILWWIIYKIAY